MTEQVWVANFPEIRSFEVAPGVSAQPVFGEALMLNLLRFQPGAIVPLHSHPHEQIGWVLGGELGMQSGGHDYELTEGGVYALRPNVEHSGLAGQSGCVVLDVFNPVRDDYRDRWTRSGQRG